jgi:GNAT superfamily N-acetyltransferase
LTDETITIRRATPDDTRRAYDLSMQAITDYFARQGISWALDLEQFWKQLEAILRHMALHHAEWWIAEDVSDGSLVGYSRSVERGALIELSELFVRPDRQSAGLGRRLIDLALPAGRGEVRVIIATTDVRALALYYRAGTVVRFPIASMVAPSVARPLPADAGPLEAIPVTLEDVPGLAAIEAEVIGYPRTADYSWLIEQREGHLYRRDGRVLGFGFVSRDGSGPIAALEPADQSEMLLHLEGRAHALSVESISFDVPTINEVAMRHLLARGFKIDAPLTMFMSSVPFGKFDRFIAFTPGIVL